MRVYFKTTTKSPITSWFARSVWCEHLPEEGVVDMTTAVESDRRAERDHRVNIV